MKKLVLLLLIAGLGRAPTSVAADGIAVEAGQGNATDMGRISLIRQWDNKWFTDGNGYLTGYWEASIGRWHSSSPGGNAIWDLGFTPVFRLQSRAENGFRPYVEGAIGVHLVDHTQVNSGRDLGSAFQFGDHLGVGLVLGGRGQFDLGYRYQHLSNADIKKPNDGINFQQLRFAYLF